jgi:hypothetical protein
MRTIFVVLLLAAGCRAQGGAEQKCGEFLDSCSETCKGPTEKPADPTDCWNRCADAYASCRQDR